MAHDALFDSVENKALLAVCTRRLIRQIGVGGILWGLINVVLGALFMAQAPLNVGLLALGVVMLGTGVQALRHPTLAVLLTETWVTVFLFCWNLAITVINVRAGSDFDVRGLVFPLVFALTLARQYRSLRHLREAIASIPEAQIKATKQLCREILKRKPRRDPSIAPSADGRSRAQLLPDRAFLLQRDQLRAFTVTRAEFARAVKKLNAPRWTVSFQHPLGTLAYRFDKPNTRKLQAWLAAAVVP